MANIIFNNKNHQINDTSLSQATNDLKQHLSTVMNGSGATINFGGVVYPVDSAKLTTATNDFASYLSTVSGNGIKVVIGGTEYSIDSAKMNNAINNLGDVLSELESGGSGGLDQDFIGAKFTDGTVLSWDELKLEENGTKYGYDYSAISDTSIAPFAFNKCTSLISINIPDTVYRNTFMGRCIFQLCDNLISVNLPNGIINIGDLMFSQCKNLTSINIPSGVTSIGSSAFQGCIKLNTINYEGTIDKWNKIYFGHGWNYNGVPATEVTCSDGTVSLV